MNGKEVKWAFSYLTLLSNEMEKKGSSRNKDVLLFFLLRVSKKCEEFACPFSCLLPMIEGWLQFS